MKIKTQELLDYAAPKLIEKFGRNTRLDKFDLMPSEKAKSPCLKGPKVWFIIKLGEVFGDYKHFGSGKTPKDALDAAGLEGLVEDLKELKKKEASHVA